MRFIVGASTDDSTGLCVPQLVTNHFQSSVESQRWLRDIHQAISPNSRRISGVITVCVTRGRWLSL